MCVSICIYIYVWVGVSVHACFAEALTFKKFSALVEVYALCVKRSACILQFLYKKPIYAVLPILKSQILNTTELLHIVNENNLIVVVLVVPPTWIQMVIHITNKF